MRKASKNTSSISVTPRSRKATMVRWFCSNTCAFHIPEKLKEAAWGSRTWSVICWRTINTKFPSSKPSFSETFLSRCLDHEGFEPTALVEFKVLESKLLSYSCLHKEHNTIRTTKYNLGKQKLKCQRQNYLQQQTFLLPLNLFENLSVAQAQQVWNLELFFLLLKNSTSDCKKRFLSSQVNCSCTFIVTRGRGTWQFDYWFRRRKTHVSSVETLLHQMNAFIQF